MNFSETLNATAVSGAAPGTDREGVGKALIKFACKLHYLAQALLLLFLNFYCSVDILN